MPTLLPSNPFQLTLKLKQVLTFYFSNAQLPWLYRTLNLTHSQEGWIPLTLMLKLKRIQSLTQNINLLVTAMQHLTSLLELNASLTEVRRLNTSSHQWQSNNGLNNYSIHASGLPLNLSIEEAKVYFEKFGPLISIQKCKINPDTFWIQYEQRQHANTVLCQTHLYNGQPFYVRFEKTPLKFKLDKDNAIESSISSSNSNSNVGTKSNLNFKSGCILCLSDIPPSVTPLDIKTFFGAYGTIHSLHRISSSTTWIRYTEPLAYQLRDLFFPNHRWISNHPEFCQLFKEANVSVLQGQEEYDYYDAKRKRPLVKLRSSKFICQQLKKRHPKKKLKQLKKKNEKKLKHKKIKVLHSRTLVQQTKHKQATLQQQQQKQKQPRSKKKTHNLNNNKHQETTSSLSSIQPLPTQMLDPLVESLERTFF